MLDMTKFAKDVHAVAVEHGWWEGEENNDIDTKIALIPSPAGSCLLFSSP